MKCKSFVAQAKYESVCVCVYIKYKTVYQVHTRTANTHTAHTHNKRADGVDSDGCKKV